MSCNCLVTKETIDPITAQVGYQGNPRDPGTKSPLTFVECQPDDSNFWKIIELCYKLNEDENRE